MIESSNVFYISNFNTIGGVETFIYELAKKYCDYDITVLYRTGDAKQIARLRKYVRVIHFADQHIKCKKAFFNYETDIIDHIDAEEYIQIIHASFKTQGLIPFVNPKINRYLSVSSAAGAEWTELTGNEVTLCRNPLSFPNEDKKTALLLISATRLTKEKGKQRMKRLGELLNAAGAPYIWFVFTNDTERIDNPNIVYMSPRLDIRPYIASVKGKGYGVQLSDSEGDCYFTRECEALGVPLLVTPVQSFKEQGLVDGKNCYYLPFDMENIDINKIVHDIPKYAGYIGEDQWDSFLVHTKSTYQEEKEMKYKVRATENYQKHNITDSQLGRIPAAGEEFTVDAERLSVLQGNNDHGIVFVDVVEVIKPQKKTAPKGGKKK